MTRNKEAHIIDIAGDNRRKKFIIIGGMHGNETNGIDAIKKILPELKKVMNPQEGTIYFLKGNLQALAKKERFIEQDLNRLWLEENIDKPVKDIADFKALHVLNDLIVNDICQGEFQNCIFLDLHTFSAESGIFAIPACNKKSIEFAKSFGVPFIEKLSETLPGTALSYFGRKGMTSVVFEGGKHESPEATENLTAALWHSLAYFGFVDENLPEVVQSRQILNDISKKLPHHLELVYRHKLEDYHNFKMNPGYFNFKPVDKQEDLAVQNQQTIKSPNAGYMLMPLYQKKGSDGFFIVKEK
jgi:succinylglutamate desuccinylase